MGPKMLSMATHLEFVLRITDALSEAFRLTGGGIRHDLLGLIYTRGELHISWIARVLVTRATHMDSIVVTLPAHASLDQLPALQPPLGVTPNFNDPENIQSTIIATLAVTLGAATFFTAVRMYTKVFILKSFALEDCSSPLSFEVNLV